MPKLQCRDPIALGTIAVALLWSKPAVAQGPPPHGHGGAWNSLVIGTHFEISDRAHAEKRLGHLRARLQRDAALGNPAAVDYDAYRIAKTRFRIGVDEWLIRYNTCQQLGPYPYPICLDPQSAEAIGQYRPLPIGP